MTIPWFVVALVTAALAPPNVGEAVAQSPVRPATYSELLDAYAQGRREEAVAQLAQWDGARVRDAARRLLAIESENRLRAAALLHTDALLSEGPSEVHYTVARDAVEKLRRSLGTPPDEGARRFCVGWCIVATGYLLFYGHDPLVAQRLLDGPWQDAEILLAQGSIIEARFDDPPTFYRKERGELGGEEWSHRPPPRERPEVLLKDAETKYRAALAKQPSSVEARLRLGRLLLLQGKHEEAFAELELARHEARDTPLRYLALLFTGAGHEKTGNHEGALAAFAAATRECPTCQASRLARANVLQAGGRMDEARVEARGVFGEPGTVMRRPGRDPWWFYHAAQFWDTDRRMNELRAMLLVQR